MKWPQNIPKWVYYLVIFMAFGMLYAITEWGWEFLISPFLFLIGMAVLSYGVLTAVPLVMSYYRLRDTNQKPRLPLESLAEIARGVSFVLLGFLLAVGALVRLLDVWEPLWAYLTRRPGWLFEVTGVGFFLVSIQGLFKSEQRNQGWGQFLSLLPRWIMSGVGILLALGLIGLGLLELLWRPGFNAIVQEFLDFLPQIPVYE